MSKTSQSAQSRRSVLVGMGAFGAAAMSGSFLSLGKASAEGEQTVKMQLGWLASNGILGEVAAEKLGYFAEYGLALDIAAGGPNIDGVASVASGQADFGSISSSPSLMLARSAGIPIKCIAAGYQRHPFTYFSLEKNPVREPKDMIGKTIGTNGTAKILLSALLAANDISEDDVKVVVIGSDMTPLMTGQVDVITGWNTNTNALSVIGDQRVDLTLWDAGVQLYANPYYVTDKMLEENGETVANIVRAASRGWGWVYENPEQAVDYLIERFPNLEKESEMAAVPLINDYSFNDKTAAGGWGIMTKENWQAQIDAYDALGQFDGDKPDVDEMMTLSVLEETADIRPKLG